MVPRRQLDIGWSDLLRGLAMAFTRESGGSSSGSAFAGETSIHCLSARSALDLLLTGLALPPGSEVLVSALTIPDMPRILEAHGLVPVPLDLDFATARVDPARLREAVSPKTRALLVAHLFGGYGGMAGLLRIAREAGLFVIEDCAQSFRGPGFTGDPESDAVLFSFGPIKTATATGGGVLFLRDPDLRNRLRLLHLDWPRQPRGEHLLRLLRFGLFKGLLSPRVYPLLVGLIRLCGRDHDALVTGAARSFRKGDFFSRIRRRPCAPLCRLMVRRIRNYPVSRLEERATLTKELLEVIPRDRVPGLSATVHTHWVLPVVIEDPDALRLQLLARGFDATRAASSMRPVAAPDHLPESDPQVARRIHRDVLYLPCDRTMTRAQSENLLALLRENFESSDREHTGGPGKEAPHPPVP